MSEWKKVKLGEICDIRSGKRLPKGTDFAKSITPYKYIRARDIKDGHINGDNLVYITEEVREKIKKYIVNTNDIAITIAGSIGEVAYVNQDFNDVNLTENAVRLTNFKDNVNSLFIFYVLKSNTYHELMNKKAGGVAQPKLGIYKIEDIEIRIPLYKEQLRIAHILSRYDTLIENCQHQIKLLEEAAQRLYKEWFVDLKFPGHEKVKIVNGVPEGWEEETLSDIAEFRRGKTITKKEIINGNIPVIAGGLTPAYYCNKSNTKDRVITISASGANAGFTNLHFQNVWASDCSFVDSSMTSNLYYVYCFLKANKIQLDNLQKGSAQPHVYAKDINGMSILIPNREILSIFENMATSIFERIGNLQHQIHLLTEARDRLLPKLMSGEIAV